MNPSIAPESRARVEEFRRKHRIGLVTLLFTDIVGSTKLKQLLGDHEAVSLIQRHHTLVREILARFAEGQEIETAGDSFFLVFAKPSDAVKFALSVQSKLRVLAKEIACPMCDRIGIHVGEVFIAEEEKAENSKHLYGIQVDTCARVMSLGQGDQILMTRFAFDNARQVLKGRDIEGIGPLSWSNHGPYVIKGVEEPLEICEVGEIGTSALSPPATSEKAHRHVSADHEPVLGWRPALEQPVPNTKWILEKKLGEGGFGEVWLGWHETLKERRVFKFCFRADRVRSLKREVTLFRLLKEKVGQHPNIVGIQEVFFDQPPFYIVMDYAEGQDLKTWSEERGGVERIPLETRLEIVAQVADALAVAHKAGVIHRDVKPSNILVSGGAALECGSPLPLSVSKTQPAGRESEPPPAIQSARGQAQSKTQAKLTDFGIGQVVSQEALAGLTRMGFTQTMMSPASSSQTGTHLYMAPELLAGKSASTRSDIYSLGIVLYQLLIGDFTRPVTTDWARRIADSLLREDLEKCFAGDPEERFASVRELAQNLRTLSERQHSSAAREKTAYRQRMIRRACAGLLAIGAVMLIVWLTLERASKTHDKNFVVDEPGTTNSQAANAYQRAKAFIAIQKTETNLDEAVQSYKQAIELDTNYALAYVGLADAWYDIQNNFRPGPSLIKNAFEVIKKALSLNTNLADAYVIRGKLAFTPSENWDATNAVKDFRHAQKINPNLALIHPQLAFVYWHEGLLDEAIAELDQALKIDRFNTLALYLMGATLISQEKSEKAATFLDLINEQAFPSSGSLVWQKGICLFCRGQTDEALKYVEKKMVDPKLKSELESYPVINSVLAIFYAARGDTKKAEARLEVATKGDERRMDFHHTTEYIAGAYALLHKNQEAMRWLKRTADEGFPCYPYFKYDPSLKNLKGDPDFEKFMQEQEKVWKHNKATLPKL